MPRTIHASLSTRPADPDLIFMGEAEQLTGCSRQTINRLVARHKLTKHSECVADVAGRPSQRPFLRKSQLEALFVRQPEPGQPIHLADGEMWYLRDDAKREDAFDCSDIVFYHWAKQKSRLHPGRALRKRQFFIIGDRGRGRPKLQTAWKREDLEAIFAGEEGTHPERGKGYWALGQRRQARHKIRAFLDKLKAELPLPAADGLKLALGSYPSRSLIYEGLKTAGIKTRRVQSARVASYWWCLPGQKVPSDTFQPAAKQDGMNDTPPTKSSHRQRGRKASPLTLEVYEFCYEAHRTRGERKLRTIRKEAEQRFGTARAPKSDSTVTMYATRYEEHLRRQAESNKRP